MTTGTLPARVRRGLSRRWRLLRWMMERDVVHLGRGGGLGDVLLCTPALRQLKCDQPSKRIRFFTDYPMLLRGLPYIDEVHLFADRPERTLLLRYEEALPQNTHLAKLMGRSLGVEVVDPRPDCVINVEATGRCRSSWRSLPRPHIVVQRRASRWTPNKDWPETYWTQLIGSLLDRASIIEIGDTTPGGRITHPNYLDLRGQTSIEDLAAAVAAGDILICPPSGPAHIAAAARISAVVIIGGYEHPANGAYPGQTMFFSDVDCAPCWLREPCPFELKCLTKITPAEVERAVWTTVEKVRTTSD